MSTVQLYTTDVGLGTGTEQAHGECDFFTVAHQVFFELERFGTLQAGVSIFQAQTVFFVILRVSERP